MTCRHLTHEEKGGPTRIICCLVALLGFLTAAHESGNNVPVVAAQDIAADGDEGDVCTTNIERGVAVQHERPSGVDLTPDGKQLPYGCHGSEKLVLATVHLVAQKIWGA